MIRKTLTILSLIGLLLSVGAWGVSYWGISYAETPGFDGIQLWAGTFHCYDQWYQSATPRYMHNPRWQLSRKRKLRQFTKWSFTNSWHLWGIDYEWAPRASYPTLQIPLWMPTFLFAASCLAFSCLPAHRRRKRKKLGLCLKCGYDLRASKDRCPECGQEF